MIETTLKTEIAFKRLVDLTTEGVSPTQRAELMAAWAVIIEYLPPFELRGLIRAGLIGIQCGYDDCPNRDKGFCGIPEDTACILGETSCVYRESVLK